MRILVRLISFLLLLAEPCVQAGQVTIAWDANTEPTLAGYRISYGQNTGQVPGVYTTNVNAGNRTSYLITGLRDGGTYYFAVRAYDTSGELSLFSDEINVVVVPAVPVP